MSAEPPSASMGWLAAQGGSIVIACSVYSKLDPCPVHQVGGEEAVKRWGAGVTLADLEARMKCLNCKRPVKCVPLLPSVIGEGIMSKRFEGARTSWPGR